MSRHCTATATDLEQRLIAVQSESLKVRGDQRTGQAPLDAESDPLKARGALEASRARNGLRVSWPKVYAEAAVGWLRGPAATFSRTPTRVRWGAPALGADTDEILHELGIDEAERRRLREDGTIQ